MKSKAQSQKMEGTNKDQRGNKIETKNPTKPKKTKNKRKISETESFLFFVFEKINQIENL